MAEINQKRRKEETRREDRKELNPEEIAKRIIIFMMFCKKIGLFFRTDLFLAFKEFESTKEGWYKFAFLFRMMDKKLKTSIPLTKKIGGLTIRAKVPVHPVVTEKAIDEFFDEEAFATVIEMIPLEEFQDFLTIEAKKVMFEKKEVYAIIIEANFDLAQERLGELEDEEEKKSEEGQNIKED